MFVLVSMSCPYKTKEIESIICSLFYTFIFFPIVFSSRPLAAVLLLKYLDLLLSHQEFLLTESIINLLMVTGGEGF